MNRILSHLIPGVLLIAMAFYAGSVKNITIGLFGFLAFFVIGVTLIVEGVKKR